MTNETREDLRGKLEESTADEPSGKIDGLDQAMDTETIEQETGGEVDIGGDETYSVQRGDSLRSIARRFYGDGNDYQRIMDANPSDLRASEMVRPGQNLTIPR